MTTLDDLREAFATMQRQAPTQLSARHRAGLGLRDEPTEVEPIDLVRDLPARVTGSRRRRWLIPAAVTIAVAAAATIGYGLTRPEGAPVLPSSGYSTGGTDLHFAFTVDAVPGYQIVPESISAGQQQAGIVPEPNAHSPLAPGLLQVWAAGQVRPDAAPSLLNVGPQVQVKVGDQIAWVDDQTIAWRWAPNRWANITMSAAAPSTASVAQRQAELVKLADAVHFPTRGPSLRLPFRVGYLPADMSVSEAYADPRAPAQTTVTLSDGEGTITVGASRLAPGETFCNVPGAAKFTWNGSPGCAQSGSGGGSSLLVHGVVLSAIQSKAGTGAYTRAELRQVVETMSVVSDIGDLESWYDASRLFN